MSRFKFQDGSKTVWAAVKEHKDRQRNVLIGALLALVLVGGGGYAIFRYLGTQAAEKLVDSWSALHRCVVGDALKQGEKPSVRFRAQQLTALTMGDLARAPGKGDPWPERCSPLAHVLQAAAKDAGKAEEGKQDLGYWAEQLAVQLKQEGAFSKDLSEPVDQLWAEANKVGIQLKPKPEQAAPPEPAQALTVDAFAQAKPVTAKPFELKGLQTEVNPGPTLRFLVDDKDQPESPFLCTFKSNAATARCAKLPKAVAEAAKTGFHLFGTVDEEGAPLVFAGAQGNDGVFRTDTAVRVATAGFLGAVMPDGMAVSVGLDAAKTGLELLRLSGDKPKTQPVSPTTFQLKPEDLQRDVQLLWGQLVLRGKSTTDETWLAAAEVQSGATALGPVTQIGQLTDTAPAAAKATQAGPRITGCRTSEATVLRAEHGGGEFVSFFVGGKWTKPSRIDGIGGTMTCRKSEVTITRVTPIEGESALKTTIVQHRCTPASCESDTVTLEQMLQGELGLAPTALMSAVGFDGKLLVVWGASQRGGLRMRLAPAPRLAQTADVILFDDLVKDGTVQKNAALFDLRVFAFERYAVILMNTALGVHAFRVEPDGKFAPVSTSWDK